MHLQVRDEFHLPASGIPPVPGALLQPGHLITADEEAAIRGADNADELLMKCTRISDEAAANLEAAHAAHQEMHGSPTAALAHHDPEADPHPVRNTVSALAPAQATATDPSTPQTPAEPSPNAAPDMGGQKGGTAPPSLSAEPQRGGASAGAPPPSLKN